MWSYVCKQLILGLPVLKIQLAPSPWKAERPFLCAVQNSDPLDKYCDDNPEADECRVYED